VASTAIVDDGDPTGFSTVGSWTLWTGLGYHNQIHQGVAGTGSDYVTWTFNVAPGTYQVAATWAAFTNRADNAPYTVLDGTTPLGTVRVNQQLAPSDFTDQGVGWKTLGTFTVTGNTLVVRLSNDADGYLNADAIHIQKVS
jgi:hypothetical protein